MKTKKIKNPLLKRYNHLPLSFLLTSKFNFDKKTINLNLFFYKPMNKYLKI